MVKHSMFMIVYVTEVLICPSHDRFRGAVQLKESNRHGIIMIIIVRFAKYTSCYGLLNQACTSKITFVCTSICVSVYVCVSAPEDINN